jgi:crotonobetainyl-CoA:carnitine CoA-transferase CaiB-like acyl-CoA transferase
MLSDAFKGLKVVDISQGIAGPYAGLLMRQYGADVIKIEPPQGDWARKLGSVGDSSAYSAATNAGKRSIILDLTQDKAGQVLMALCDRADVIIEAFRPGVADRLGFGYDAVRARNPHAIYISINGFGSDNANSDRPGTDSVLQAMTGMMRANAGTLDGIPHRVPGTPLDLATGLFAFQAAIVALWSRARGEPGQRIECTIVQTAVALNMVGLIEATQSSASPPPPASPVGVFQTLDGWMSISVFTDKHFKRFCPAIGCPDLADEPRFLTTRNRLENNAALLPIVRERILTYATQALLSAMEEADILAERIQSFGEFLESDVMQSAPFISRLEDPAFGSVPYCHPPGCGHDPRDLMPPAPTAGQHSRAILTDLGMEHEEIDAMLRSGAVIAPPA